MLKSRVTAVVLLALVLGGCAQPGGTAAGAPASSATATSSAPPAAPSLLPLPTGSGIVDLPVPKPSGPLQRITGTVTAGVEARCLLLSDASGLHLLLFHDPALRARTPVGAKVTLTGTPSPGRMTICQQGVPFVVTSVG